MSFEDDWPLRDDPTLDSVKTAAAKVCVDAAMGVEAEVREEDGTIIITFRAPVTNGARITQKVFGDPRPLEEIESELDAPKTGAQVYELRVDVDRAEPAEDLPARVSVYSNTLDNRAGWNVVVALADALAENLGVLPDRSLN